MLGAKSCSSVFFETSINGEIESPKIFDHLLTLLGKGSNCQINKQSKLLFMGDLTPHPRATDREMRIDVHPGSSWRSAHRHQS